MKVIFFAVLLAVSVAYISAHQDFGDTLGFSFRHRRVVEPAVKDRVVTQWLIYRGVIHE